MENHTQKSLDVQWMLSGHGMPGGETEPGWHAAPASLREGSAAGTALFQGHISNTASPWTPRPFQNTFPGNLRIHSWTQSSSFRLSSLLKCKQGDPVFKNPPCNARNTSSIPGPGRSHMPQSNRARVPQLMSSHSLVVTTEDRMPGARAPQLEKPSHRNKE